MFSLEIESEGHWSTRILNRLSRKRFSFYIMSHMADRRRLSIDFMLTCVSVVAP